jgi:cytosine/adenosine deaminase-related metal-dependent hydrolase
MILRGATVVGGDARPVDINVSNGVIAGVVACALGDAVALRDTIVFPGLFNSHDHLDFDLYPAIGYGRYRDYLEWSHDIHRRDTGLIAAIESVPRAARVRWGALKNLLGGVTAVAHHGESVDAADLGSLALLPGASIHSVRLGGRWRWRLNAPINRAPYVVHVGEGTTEEMRREVDELARWNLLRRDLIAVHAIAMAPEQASRFRAIVWCPVSNEHLYGATATIQSLKRSTTVVLGTDSTLTADWNIWNHLRRARSIGALTDDELFAAVTSRAAGLWGRPNAGRVAPGGAADLVFARRKHDDPWDAFFAVDPEDILLVLRTGAPLLVDRSIEDLGIPGASWTVRVGNGDRAREKRVAIDVPALIATLSACNVAPNIDLAAITSRGASGLASGT